MAHFLVGCGGFERDWLVLLNDVCRVVGARGKVALLVQGICNRVMEDVGECILFWLGRWWRRRKQLLYGLRKLLLDIGPPLSSHLSPSLNSWTLYIAFN